MNRIFARPFPALAALALAVSLAAPVHAQLAGGSEVFIAGGRGGGDSRLLDSQWHLSGGYETGFASSGGIEIRLRGIASYTNFNADIGAYVDSVGATSGERVEGKGGGSVGETGIDGIVGLRAGSVTIYGFYGFHYFRDFREPLTLQTDQGEFEFSTRRFNEFGTMRGWGVRLRAGDAGAFYAEWYKGGGDDEEMMEIDGIRFGLIAAW